MSFSKFLKTISSWKSLLSLPNFRSTGFFVAGKSSSWYFEIQNEVKMWRMSGIDRMQKWTITKDKNSSDYEDNFERV